MTYVISRIYIRSREVLFIIWTKALVNIRKELLSVGYLDQLTLQNITIHTVVYECPIFLILGGKLLMQFLLTASTNTNVLIIVFNWFAASFVFNEVCSGVMEVQDRFRILLIVRGVSVWLIFTCKKCSWHIVILLVK